MHRSVCSAPADWSRGHPIRASVEKIGRRAMEELLPVTGLHTDFGHVTDFILDTHSNSDVDTASSSEDRFVEVAGSSDQEESPLVSSSCDDGAGKAAKKGRGTKGTAKSRSRRSSKSAQSFEDKEKRKANERNRVREVRKTYKELRQLLTHGQDSWDAKPIKISILDGAIEYLSSLARELAFVQSQPPPSQVAMYLPQGSSSGCGPPPLSCALEPPPLEHKPDVLLRGATSPWQ